MTQKIPEQLELRDEWPRAGTGKIVRRRRCGRNTPARCRSARRGERRRTSRRRKGSAHPIGCASSAPGTSAVRQCPRWCSRTSLSSSCRGRLEVSTCGHWPLARRRTMDREQGGLSKTPDTSTSVTDPSVRTSISSTNSTSSWPSIVGIARRCIASLETAPWTTSGAVAQLRPQRGRSGHGPRSYYGDETDFARCLSMVAAGCRGLFDRLTEVLFEPALTGSDHLVEEPPH